MDSNTYYNKKVADVNAAKALNRILTVICMRINDIKNSFHC